MKVVLIKALAEDYNISLIRGLNISRNHTGSKVAGKLCGFLLPSLNILFFP